LADASNQKDDNIEKNDDTIKDKQIEKTDSQQENKQEDKIKEEKPEKQVKPEQTDKVEKKKTEEIKQESKEKQKSEKVEDKKEKTPKKEHKNPDFKYIVRISNSDIDGEKNVVYGLTSVKGIGIKMATIIADETKIDRYKKIGDLKESEIEKLQSTIDNIKNLVPTWMLNHRKDYETGKDLHLIGSEIDMNLRDEINIMKKIRSYRGIRHERGLPVRGQRTRANNRKGLALGVSKKREQK